METKKKHELSLAKRMAISLVCGLVAGLAFMFLREHLNASGQAQTWTTINNLLFQDITAEGAERSFGIFYIIGQLFIKALQLVIIPMVFTSISLAIGSIADTRTMGRISAKTLFWFLLCSFLALLLAFLIIAYPLVIALGAKLDPFTFIRKIANVAVFGFSTSSSAATLPLNIKVCEEEFGVDESIASFVLPLGMTINMDGTAIMQVIATVFIAGCAGYTVTPGQLVVVALLALLASVGTPAAPGAGAVILFTILSGMGFVNDGALLAYSLILAINRPIEMLVTSLNVVGDAVASICVARSEGLLNEETFNK